MKFISEKNIITNPDKILQPDEILDIKNLNVSFKTKAGLVRAVRGIDLTVRHGEIVGLVGESGSGKSVSVKSVIGFNDGSTTTADSLNLDNIDITSLKKSQWPYIRGTRVAYIPQDPLMSLNPTKKISAQIIETIKITEYRDFQWNSHRLLRKHNNVKSEAYKQEYAALKKAYKANVKKEAMYNRMIEILQFIGIENPERRVQAYPHEFSGGMRQRIAIAMAIAAKPELIIADEPTTALDVTIQAKVLQLIKKLRDELNVAIIFISHNIALVANFCDYIYVMYAGRIIEKGTRKDIFTNAAHPYTWALISSIPDSASTEPLSSIIGTPPNMLSPPKGDAFAPRNQYALKIDFEVPPPMFKLSDTHYAATWLCDQAAPRIDIPKDVLDKEAIAAASIEILESENGQDHETVISSESETQPTSLD